MSVNVMTELSTQLPPPPVSPDRAPPTHPAPARGVDSAAESSDSPEESRAQRWGILSLLIGAVILFLGRVCLNFFAYWDDQDFIFKNPHVTTPTLANLVWFWEHTHELLYVPVTMDAFVGLAKLAKLPNSAGMENPFDPAYFHAASLLTHIASVLVVYTLLKFLFQRPWAACAGALLFALHPVQVEPLAWTCGLKDLLAGLFSLLAIWQYLLYASVGNARFPSKRFSRPRNHFAVAMGAIVIGELCKPSAMVAPVIAIVLDYLLIGRPLKDVLRSAIPVILIAIPLAVIAKVVQPENTGPGIPLYLRPLIATDALAFYLYKFAVPFNLAPDYARNPHRNLTHHWFFWTWIAPLAVGILILAWRKKYPWLLAAALVSLISLGPVLGLSNFSFEGISAVADHYLYVAMLGPAIALAAIFQKTRPRWAIALAGVWIVALGARSFGQVGYWRDDITLWQHAKDVAPDGMAVGLNLAASDIRLGKQFSDYADKRVAQIQKADGHASTESIEENDKTVIECRHQEQAYAAKSEQISRHLIDVPEFQDGLIQVRAYRNLILALSEEKRTDDAVDWGFRLLQVEVRKNVQNPHQLSLDREALGFMLLDTKTRNPEAAEILQEATNLDPDNVEAQRGLAIARARLANPSRQAAVDFAQAIESGDMKRVHEVAVGSDDKFNWVSTFSGWTVAYKHYQEASARKFGKDAHFFVETSDKMVNQVEDAEEKIDGDKATLTCKTGNAQSIQVIKTNGAWKVDIDALWKDVDTAQSVSRVKLMADIYDEMTRDVDAGKFKTAQDAQTELKGRISSRLPQEFQLMNNGKPTTLPANLPPEGKGA
jgi:protein O-mannosyl-transferase